MKKISDKKLFLDLGLNHQLPDLRLLGYPGSLYISYLTPREAGSDFALALRQAISDMSLRVSKIVQC